MGRLGYIRPDTAHAIGGAAELSVALQCSIIPTFTAGPKHYSVMTTGWQGAAGAWALSQHPPELFLDYGPLHPQEPQDLSATTGQIQPRTPTPNPTGQQYLAGTTGRIEQLTD